MPILITLVNTIHIIDLESSKTKFPRLCSVVQQALGLRVGLDYRLWNCTEIKQTRASAPPLSVSTSLLLDRVCVGQVRRLTFRLSGGGSGHKHTRVSPRDLNTPLLAFTRGTWYTEGKATCHALCRTMTLHPWGWMVPPLSRVFVSVHYWIFFLL